MGNDKPIAGLTDFECKARKAFGDRRLEHRRGRKPGYLNLGVSVRIKSRGRTAFASN